MSTQANLNPFFTPTQISGCTLWLDAADPATLTLSGSNVIQWRDKTSNATTLSVGTGTPTLTNFNGLPSINFNGSSRMQRLSYTRTSGVTNINWFVVANVSNVNLNFGLLIGTGYASDFYTQNSLYINSNNLTSFFRITRASSSVSVSRAVTAGGMIASSSTSLSTGIYSVTLNGSQTSSSGGPTGTQDALTVNLYIGNDNYPGAAFVTGTISECLLYTTLLSVLQQQQIEGYLAWKWGLQANLPANHPYKTSPIAPLLNPPTTPASFQISPWNPTLLPNLGLWLDAADSSTLTFSGNNIIQWNDKSGLNNHATQSTAANGPTYTSDSGYPSLLFTRASQQYMIGPSLLNTTSYGIFLVYRSLSSALTQYIFFNYKKTTGGTGQNYIQHLIVGGARDSAIVYGESPVTLKDSQNVAAPTTRNIYEIIDSPTNTTQNFFQIGSPLNTAFTNGGVENIATDAYGYTLGTLRTTTVNLTNPFDGYFNEVIVYLREPTTAQRQQIEGYLAWKWGLQESLPPWHPYKNNLQISPPVKMTFTSWQPPVISGLGLWLDAADRATLTLTGTGVTQWRDKSGNGNNATSFTTLPNFYNNSVTFNSSGLATNYTASTNIESGFLVCRSFSGGNTTLLGSYNGNGGRQFRLNNGDIQTVKQEIVNVLTGGGPVLSGTVLINYVNNGSRLTHYANGSFYATGAALAYDAGRTTSIGWRFGGFEPLNGFIQEIVIYTTPLTNTERQNVEGYLAWKWGLQGNLPKTHPNFYTPPPPP